LVLDRPFRFLFNEQLNINLPWKTIYFACTHSIAKTNPKEKFMRNWLSILDGAYWSKILKKLLRVFTHTWLSFLKKHEQNTVKSKGDRFPVWSGSTLEPGTKPGALVPKIANRGSHRLFLGPGTEPNHQFRSDPVRSNKIGSTFLH